MSLSAVTPQLARHPALLLHQLVQSRGGRPLFVGLDLALHAGDLLWVQGRNGVGKTSLLRLICGLSAPVTGRVHVEPELLYIAHKPGLKDHLTVVEQLRSSAALAGRACSEAEALAALAPVGLLDAAHQRQARLSEGQRRRAALAPLWLPQVPHLWVLDEPLAALDTAMVDRLAQRLDRHAADGGCAVFTSHQPPAAARAPGGAVLAARGALMSARWQAAAALARREWVGLRRQPAEWLTPLAFVVSVVLLFPLGLGAEPARLRELAPGLLWIVALLACLLSVPRLFAADLADGSLDQWWLSPLPRPLSVALKLAVHWGATGLPWWYWRRCWPSPWGWPMPARSP